MQVFGLTGGVASGKSTVAGWFREAGVPVVDADELARRVVAAGQPTLAALVARFGESIVDADGALIRAELAKRAFQDPEALRALNAITHPAIARLAAAEFQGLEAEGHTLAGYDVPLLFERGLEAQYQPVVVAYVDRETQLQRAQARSGWTPAEALARIDAQIPLDEKRLRADYVIDTGRGLDVARAATLDVLRQMRATIRRDGPEAAPESAPR